MIQQFSHLFLCTVLSIIGVWANFFSGAEPSLPPKNFHSSKEQHFCELTSWRLC